MTREKAIECNKNLIEYMRISDKTNEYKFLEDNYVALNMSIKALEFVGKLAEVEKLYEEYKIDVIEKSKRIVDLYKEIGIWQEKK